MFLTSSRVLVRVTPKWLVLHGHASELNRKVYPSKKLFIEKLTFRIGCKFVGSVCFLIENIAKTWVTKKKLRESGTLLLYDTGCRRGAGHCDIVLLVRGRFVGSKRRSGGQRRANSRRHSGPGVKGMPESSQCICQTFVLPGEGGLRRQKLLLKANLVLERGNQKR